MLGEDVGHAIIAIAESRDQFAHDLADAVGDVEDIASAGAVPRVLADAVDKGDF